MNREDWDVLREGWAFERLRQGLLGANGLARTRRDALRGDAGPGSLEPSLGSSGIEQSSPGSEQTSEQSSPGAVKSSEGSALGSEETRGWTAMEDPLDAVLAFCAEHWCTLPEIAEALGRRASTVRTKYLRPLLERGALVRKYPDNPRQAHQAYRAAKTHA